MSDEPASIYRRLGGEPLAPVLPGAPATAAVAPAAPTPLPGQAHYVLASWGRRGAAYFLDGIVFGLLGYVVHVAICLGYGLTVNEATLFYVIPVPGPHVPDSTPLYVARGIAALVPGLGTALAMAMTDGRTPGKSVFHLRVVKADGTPMRLGTAFYRQFLLQGVVLNALLWASGGLLYLANYVLPLGDAEHRAGHDRLARTRVVRDEPSGAADE